MPITNISRMIDISAVRTDADTVEILSMCEAAKKHGFIAVFPMPWYAEAVVDIMRDRPDIHVGGVVGFPSGAEKTETKVYMAQTLLEAGCHEIDMVMNVGALKSGLGDFVARDILSVRGMAKDITLKVIIEAALLTEGETETAVKIAAECGADFVKSGTGWHGATSLEKYKIMIDGSAGRCLVKAAGGIRTLATLRELANLGVSRFGIGVNSALSIMDELCEGNVAEGKRNELHSVF